MSLVSLNVTSFEANLPALQQLAYGHNAIVLALQESRHARDQLPELTTAAASALSPLCAALGSRRLLLTIAADRKVVF